MVKFFAAFIITYERASILKNTIDNLLNQTLPPEKILIVDNGESFDTLNLIKSINYQMVEYLRVGYNAGPAGAAKIGLQKLAVDNYDWIYWGDDDDPPKRQDCFEMLFTGIGSLHVPGIVGAVGHTVDRSSMIIKRTPDHLLENAKWLKVDSIAGGMCMIVNSDVVKMGVIPDARIFYGFEELDFCMKAQKAGFSIYVLTELFKYYRANSKRDQSTAGKRGLMKDIDKLWREYYSARNILYILAKNKMFSGFLYTCFRLVGKIVYGFRYGIFYGFRNAKFILLGVLDYFTGRMGKRTFL